MILYGAKTHKTIIQSCDPHPSWKPGNTTEREMAIIKRLLIKPENLQRVAQKLF